MKSMNRREFVVLTAGAVCAGAAAGCAGTGGAAPRWSGPTTFQLGGAAELARQGVDARWAKSGGFFVVREGGRLFAVSATCTHKDCDVAPVGAEYVCDCHGSRFTSRGEVRTGPAVRSLPRFGIAVDAGGHVVVDRTKVYWEGQWGDAGAFVRV